MRGKTAKRLRRLSLTIASNLTTEQIERSGGFRALYRRVKADYRAYPERRRAMLHA